MAPYDDEVQEKLGEQAWKRLIHYVDKTKVTAQQAKDIARLLEEKRPHSVIFSAHSTRMKTNNWDSTELRCILDNWYSEELFKLDRKDALSKLAKIFDHESVRIHPLAHELRELIESEEREAENMNKR